MDALVEGLERAGSHNPSDQARPVAILWPDKERQWAVLLPELRQRLPLLAHSTCQSEERADPGTACTCKIARTSRSDSGAFRGAGLRLLPRKKGKKPLIPGTWKSEDRCIRFGVSLAAAISAG